MRFGRWAQGGPGGPGRARFHCNNVQTAVHLIFIDLQPSIFHWTNAQTTRSDIEIIGFLIINKHSLCKNYLFLATKIYVSGLSFILCLKTQRISIDFCNVV